MKIAVGTTSKQKIQYLQEVLNELNIDAVLIPLEVLSEISEQPMSFQETKKGSVNRAKNALANCDDADVALGVEVGYHPNSKGDYKILCWATLIDKNGRQVSTPSHRLLLPQFHQQKLKEGEDLRHYVRLYMAENPDDLSQELGIIIRDRKPFIQTSIKLALFEYLFS